MNVYEPREDSFLLEKYVEKHAKGRVLDMGTGSGIQALAAASSSKVESVVAVDVQKKVIENCRENVKNKKIEFLHSNLFSNVKGVFDVIVCNPPYLPEDKRVKDITLDGGKKGYEFIAKFLEEASLFLKDNGIILLLFSSLTKKEKVEEVTERHGFEWTELEKNHLSFEDLFVYKIRKSSLLRALCKKNITKISFFMKGKRGCIFTAQYQGKKVAVKAKNPASKAVGRMKNEVDWLKKLNEKGIGPFFYFSGKEFFVYEFVEGAFIIPFIEKRNSAQIRQMFKDVFCQLFVLDKMNANKEEMHHPYKHIIISKTGPILIDFERMHHTKSPSNVTQFCQCVSSSYLTPLLRKKKLNINKQAMIQAAQQYKKKRSKESFENILALL